MTNFITIDYWLKTISIGYYKFFLAIRKMVSRAGAISIQFYNYTFVQISKSNKNALLDGITDNIIISIGI